MLDKVYLKMEITKEKRLLKAIDRRVTITIMIERSEEDILKDLGRNLEVEMSPMTKTE